MKVGKSGPATESDTGVRCALSFSASSAGIRVSLPEPGAFGLPGSTIVVGQKTKKTTALGIPPNSGILAPKN
jgi:hypothetical protein